MEQAVLGATGNMGELLVDELVAKGISVRALNRSWPEGLQKNGVEFLPVDVEQSGQLIEATKNVDVLYVTIAIPYGIESWQRGWPIAMQNIIDAGKTNKCKIVFLDNVYMYGRVDGPMTEESPVKPLAKKGLVRAQIADMLQDAMKRDEVTAVIARSADFYGPHTRISDGFFVGAFEKGVVNWLGNTSVMRTWNYTLDNAKALAILGNDARAEQQIWHMPAAPAMKGAEFIALASKLLGKHIQVTEVPGDDDDARTAFAHDMPEIAEMMYQYDSDYVFDSTKFQETFGMKPTSYEEGFKHVFDVLAQEKQSKSNL